MNGHPASCRDCIPCEGDCDGPAFCVSEPGTRPCPHDGIWCEECRIDGCISCRLEAERDMYDTGVYDPRADPLYNHHAADAAERHHKVLEGYKKAEGYDPVTNATIPKPWWKKDES